jgi:hypothetical protein
MKLPYLVAGSVMALVITSALAQTPPAGTPANAPAMPNANQTPEAPANGTMPNANGTPGSNVNPNGTTSTGSTGTGTATTPPRQLDPNCLPGQTPQAGTNCPPPATTP